jgi:small-conductance mechanosensitive channel
MGIFAILSPLQKDGLVASAILVVVACVAIIVKHLAFGFLGRVAARRSNGVLGAVLRRAAAPCEFIVPLIAVDLAVLPVRLQDWIKEPVERVVGLCIIAAIAWALIALVGLAGDLAKRRYQLDAEDNLHARQAETRLDILERTATTVVLLVSVSIMLMTFPPIRAIGATLLASAGLVGLAAGFAARPFLENLVAGLQIALTQPIRIDDVVFVEHETGRIEKITATYVVVRLWDLRRMVLPITYFINTPFQNWTYSTANLIGSVVLTIDYSVPIGAIRDEVNRILANTILWDKQVGSAAMTDATKDSAEIRILVSARNSAQLFDLRCLVRERLVHFISENYPGSLPGTHAESPEQPVPAGAGSR